MDMPCNIAPYAPSWCGICSEFMYVTLPVMFTAFLDIPFRHAPFSHKSLSVTPSLQRPLETTALSGVASVVKRRSSQVTKLWPQTHKLRNSGRRQITTDNRRQMKVQQITIRRSASPVAESTHAPKSAGPHPPKASSAKPQLAERGRRPEHSSTYVACHCIVYKQKAFTCNCSMFAPVK